MTTPTNKASAAFKMYNRIWLGDSGQTAVPTTVFDPSFPVNYSRTSWKRTSDQYSRTRVLFLGVGVDILLPRWPRRNLFSAGLRGADSRGKRVTPTLVCHLISVSNLDAYSTWPRWLPERRVALGESRGNCLSAERLLGSVRPQDKIDVAIKNGDDGWTLLSMPLGRCILRLVQSIC